MGLREDLKQKTAEELRKLAAERNIEGRSDMDKDELVLALEESLAENPPRIG